MNGLPPRTVGSIGSGAGSLGSALLTARAPAGQTLPGDADASTAAATVGSFMAMLSAVDATGFGDADEGPGRPAMSTAPTGPDEPGSQVDASRDTALAAAPDAVVPLPPVLPVPFDPALLLLAQGARSMQPAAAASVPAAAAGPAVSVATTTAGATDGNGSSRAATAERFSPLAQRPAGMAGGAVLQPALRGPVGSAVPAPAPVVRSFEVAATRVKPLDLAGSPAASTLSAGASGFIATATATSVDCSAFAAAAPVGAQETTPVFLGATVTNAADDVTTPADAAPAATTQAGRPTGAVGVDGPNAPGLAGTDRLVPKPAPHEAAQSLPAVAQASTSESILTAAAVRAAERPARQSPPVASGASGAAEPQPTTRVGAIESVLLRTDMLPLAGRIGRDEERRSDGDGIAASGPFALPSASGAASVGAVSSGHAAHAGGSQAASIERLVDQVSWWLAQKSGNADFSIDMPDGQALSVSVQVRGNEAQVIFRSDQPELRQLIGQAMPQLKESFGQEGLLLSNASVSAHAGPGHGSQNGHAPSVPYQPSGRPAGADDRQLSSAETPVAAVPTRRTAFGATGRSLDLYV